MQAQAASTVEKPKRKLHPTCLREAAVARNVWSVIPPDGTGYDEMFRPEFWSHVAKQMRSGDIIEATAEDGSWFAQLYVLAVASQSVAVVELRRIDLQDANLPDVDARFAIAWKGPALKYCVIRISDNSRIYDKIETRAAAQEQLAGYLKALSR